MLIEFAVENFRSIKNRQVFSLVAESSKIKGDNVFEASLPNGGSLRLLKIAVLYGANASGKSNLIKALGSFVQLVRRRIPGAGRPVSGFDPFLFSKETPSAATVFELTFLFEGIKYNYKVAFKLSHVVQEDLIYFPKGQPQQVFSRSGEASDLLHKAKLGKNFGNKDIEVFNNQLVLNKFGTDTPHETLSKLYTYFATIDIGNAFRSSPNGMQIRRTSQRLTQPDRQFLLKRLIRLIQVADTKIDGIEISQSEESQEFTTGFFNENGELVERIAKRPPVFQVSGVHAVYENGIATSAHALDFEEESEGTKALFWRGGLILEKLETGGVLVFDELDNSLHPKLVKFLVKLFANPRANPKNAQLIFATHEVTLLDRDLFRTDQIWFAEKNEKGETELFSAQDFDGVREDVPFDKWYMAGKFGGLPKIEDIESIFTT